MRRLSLTTKLTVLLALLSTLPLLVVGNREQLAKAVEESLRQRIAVCEEIAISCSLHLHRQDRIAIEKQIEQFAQRSPNVESIRLVRFDGLIVQSIGNPEQSWHLAADEPSTPSNVRVPILRSNRPWGNLEVAFTETGGGSTNNGEMKNFIIALALNLVSFGLLLRRSLPALNSSNAVPRRVRNTLDTLAGGVVILDGQKRIVLANETFQKSCGIDGDKLIGRSLDKFNWRFADACTPWETAINTKLRCSGATVFLLEESKAERCFVVNATPVFDAKEQLAGTLVSFEDVTTLEQQKQSLINAVSEIERSRELIHEQNLRLQELASKDALTGAWNRRALFEELDRVWKEQACQVQQLNCVMLDVDHFKKLNDNYGHAAGDQVLKDVVRTITQAVDNAGVVGRYGGEEFCIILPAMAVEEAVAIAEKVRFAICEQLAEPYHVTASFGVSAASFGATSFQAMLEQADQALYSAKHGGRNAVRCWSTELVAELTAQNDQRAAELRIRSDADQPISYHAVTSLHAALAYRDAETALHSQRVAEMSVALARGLMAVGDLYVLEIAGLLHDIGKIGVPDSVLLHPGKLSQEQWRIMEAHARMGVEIVDSSFNSPALSDIVRFHHFRYDGINTPPGGPIGDAIPIGARIVCIVDAFDAMVSNRVYRPARTAEEAFAELRRCAGTQFDPVMVDRFTDLQIGWRLDSRYCTTSGPDRSAIRVGHLTERTLYAYETHDAPALSQALSQLAVVGEKHDYPAIHHLAIQLMQAVSERDRSSWDLAVPILQDLIDTCLTVQRAHVRDVACRSLAIENCPQGDVLKIMQTTG